MGILPYREARCRSQVARSGMGRKLGDIPYVYSANAARCGCLYGCPVRIVILDIRAGLNGRLPGYLVVSDFEKILIKLRGEDFSTVFAAGCGWRAAPCAY